jgi:peptide/nickel transport system substrate-binding protein
MNRKVFLILFVVVSMTFSYALAQSLPMNVPRNETLIVDMLGGTVANPQAANVWSPTMGQITGDGEQGLAMDALWYINQGTGKLIDALASEPPEFSNDYKTMTIHLRQGIYWSDGVEFTATDVVFTLNYTKESSALTFSSQVAAAVKSVYAPNKFTVVVNFYQPNPQFYMVLTCDIWWGLYIMPAHVFENIKDPASYNFFPPVSLGPYVLKDYDPQGNWFLWERRTDWQRTSLAMITDNKPIPKYVLFINYPQETGKILAMSRHDLDWIFHVTSQGWQVLQSKDPYASIWFKGFPWAYLHDPTARGIYFNCAKYPYDLTDVRWALTLTINAYNYITNWEKGMQALFPTVGGSGMQPFEDYQIGMLPELENFTLPDGFKPFDANLPYKIADWAKSQGYTVSGSPVQIWGPGWWKYAPDEAAKLLEANGFKKVNGKWYLPDGKLWTVTLITPTEEIDALILAQAAATDWRNFGIDVNLQTTTDQIAGNDQAMGYFDVMSSWDTDLQGGITDALWYTHYGWNSSNYEPIGTYAVNDSIRFKNAEMDNILNQLQVLTPDSTEAFNLSKQFLMLEIKYMPLASIGDCVDITPHDDYYWTGFPSASDPYWSPLFWCGGFKFILPHLKPTGR